MPGCPADQIAEAEEKEQGKVRQTPKHSGAKKSPGEGGKVSTGARAPDAPRIVGATLGVPIMGKRAVGHKG